ncbi:MAG: RimK family alpha-L-glutamate ligase [Planctomycetaceae bacterium]
MGEPTSASPTSADIALLTERRYAAADAAAEDWYLANILRDDELLVAALARRGLSAARVDWSRDDVDWSAFRLAVFRTTWDYFDRFPEFMEWLGRVESLTRLCNPAPLIRWNLDKHYLGDLAAQGVPVVPTRFLEPDQPAMLADVLRSTGWSQAVVKPCVSGAARHTYRVDRSTAAAVQRELETLLAREAFMLQPFVADVVTTGEDTLVAIAGRVTHGLRKRAKPGDFRVQDDHGGTVEPHEPTADQVALAERALAACGAPPAYGRVDVARLDDGSLAVMELELVEPELWLRLHPPAADAMAAAISCMISSS